MFIFISSYTEVPVDAGISAYEFDPAQGTLRLAGQLDGLNNPSYLTRQGDRLYVVCELGDEASEAVSVRIGHKGALSIEARGALHSNHACHVLVLDDQLYAANYSSGSLSILPISDGSFGDLATVNYQGSGPHQRQNSPHPHQAAAAPDGQWVYVCDLGTDTVWMHDPAVLDAPPAAALTTHSGAGPRHMVFHQDLPVAFIVCELSNDVIAAEWDSETGLLSVRQKLPLLAEEQDTGPSAGAVRIHPGGKALYVSLRGPQEIAVFDIAADGTLANRTQHPAGGQRTRDFILTPDGEWLIAAHQDSDTVAVFPVDGKTLRPSDKPASVTEIKNPVCVTH